MIWAKPARFSPLVLDAHRPSALLFAIPLSALALAAEGIFPSLLVGSDLRATLSIGILIFAFFSALLTYLVGSYLYYMIGRRLGGRGSLGRIRTAFLTNALLAIPLTPFGILTRVTNGWLGFSVDLIYILLSIWFAIVTLHVSAAAHHFSLLRALASVALCMLSLGAFVIFVLIVYFAASGPSS